MRCPHRLIQHLIAVIAFAAIPSSVAAENRPAEADLVVVQSANSVPVTMDKLESTVKSKGARRSSRGSTMRLEQP